MRASALGTAENRERDRRNIATPRRFRFLLDLENRVMDSLTLASGARTVEHVADHFVALQASALRLLNGFDASERGYFTPSEDEETRHLLVSYWQSRNALVELVRSFHDDQDVNPNLRGAKFLVAYAGALVLVDAARFLRIHVEDRPIVRGKLNEAEPHFDIPMGTYDSVQRSLTNPIHAWHLYNAARYFNDQQSKLESLANEFQLTTLIAIIKRNQSTIGVGVADYLTARARVRAAEAESVVRRDVLGRAIYGIQKAVSQLISGISTKPDHQPQLASDAAEQMRGMLRPGDVLVTRKEHAVTNYFLPGFWPHAALYIGTDTDLQRLGLAEHEQLRPRWQRLLECDPAEPRRVLEALKDGVRIRSLASPFASDAVMVLRPQLSEAEIGQAISRGMFHESKPYDFDFDFTRSDRMVCTEVVYRSYEQVGGMNFDLTRRAGRLTLSAEDLIGMALEHRHFDVKAVFLNGRMPQVATEGEAEAIVKQTLT